MGPKGCFPFVTFSHSDQVICMPQIDFHIDVSFPGSIEKVRYQWKWIPILLSDLIETSEVNAESEGAICYALSRSETRRVFGDCTMGYGTPVSPTILSIPFSLSSCLFRLLIHPQTPSPPHFICPNFALFQVSVLLRIFVPLVLFSNP